MINEDPEVNVILTNSVDVTLSQYGKGKIVVNGVDISCLACAIRIESESKGERPKVYLTLVPKNLRVHADAEVLQVAESLPFFPENTDNTDKE